MYKLRQQSGRKLGDNCASLSRYGSEILPAAGRNASLIHYAGEGVLDAREPCGGRHCESCRKISVPLTSEITAAGQSRPPGGKRARTRVTVSARVRRGRAVHGAVLCSAG